MEPEQKTVLCEKCQKQINANNFLIHQAMCRGNRQSFVLGGLTKLKSKESKAQFDKPFMQVQEPPINQPKQPEKHPQKKETNESKNLFPNPNETQRKNKIFQNPNVDKQSKPLKPQIPQKTTPPKTQPATKPTIPPTTQPSEKPKVQPKSLPKPQQEQKFRCTDCGYMMTMKQLDTHPNSCPARQNHCQYCNLQFPHYLMQMHHEVCQRSPNRQQQQRRSEIEREHIRQQLSRRQRQDLQARNRVRPTRGERQGNIPAGIVPIRTLTYVTHEGNYRVIVKRVIDQNGRVYEERTRQPLQRQQQSDDEDGIQIIVPISLGQGGISLDQMFSGGGMEHIIRRLMTNMNINRQQNPGLTKQQIAKIPVLKYDPAANPKSTSCTICVTDFQKNDKVMQLPCGHLFHPQCLVPWLKNSAVCPNCRGKIKPS